MGLDYLHRICQVIHTDLKPENVSLCLTDQEVLDIAANGQLTTTKNHDLHSDLKKIAAKLMAEPGNQEAQTSQERVEKRAAKRKA